MPNLNLAQSVVRSSGDAVLVAALRTLVDPFRSADALPAAVHDPALPLLDGTPAWRVVLGSAWWLAPPPRSPSWNALLARCAAEARGSPGTAAEQLWTVVLAERAGVADAAWTARAEAWRADAGMGLVADAARLACGGSALLRDEVAAGQAKGRLRDALVGGTLDGAQVCTVLEAALLGGAGPADPLTREARRVLGTLQDAATGAWRGDDERHTARVTFRAVLLLMRGG